MKTNVQKKKIVRISVKKKGYKKMENNTKK